MVVKQTITWGYNLKVTLFSNSKFIVFLIIIYPLLFIWQGFDFIDTGYSLTSYQQIFNDPESVSYGFVNWLTNIIGGLWILLFGDSLGLLGINIAGILVFYLTIWLSYLILKPYIEQKYLLIGLLLALIFIRNFLFFLYYNNLTSLFFFASALFIINGLRNSKNWQIIISGLLLGFNIFIRLPNVLGFSLIFGIFFYGYISKNTVMIQVKQTISFVLGYATAILLTILAMKTLGHYEIFVNSLSMLFNMASDTKASHNFPALFVIYVKEYMKVIVFLFIGCLVLLVISKFFSLFKKHYLYYGFVITLGIVTLLCLLSNYQVKFTHYVILMSVGFLYLILLSYITNIEKSTANFRLVCSIALLILIITPLGSTNGQRIATYGMWIPIPIAFFYIFRLKDMSIEFKSTKNLSSNKFKFGLNIKETNLLRNFTVTSFIVFSLLSALLYTYQDSPNRIDMRYSIKNQRLKGIFTTKEKALAVEELLIEMNKYVNENDYLLAYNAIPMLYFLTKTKPYLYNSWTAFYSSYQLKQALEKAMNERQYLPVAVRKRSTIEDGNIIDEFIDRNGYSLAWKNDFFDILVPPIQR